MAYSHGGLSITKASNSVGLGVNGDAVSLFLLVDLVCLHQWCYFFLFRRMSAVGISGLRSIQESRDNGCLTNTPRG